VAHQLDNREMVLDNASSEYLDDPMHEVHAVFSQQTSQQFL